MKSSAECPKEKSEFLRKLSRKIQTH